MEAIANDLMVKILGLAGEYLRLVLDGSGSPVFILEDGTGKRYTRLIVQGIGR